MNWTAKARKSTVTKQGVRGEFRSTSYVVTLPWGEKIRHADKDTAEKLATTRYERVRGANQAV